MDLLSDYSFFAAFVGVLFFYVVHKIYGRLQNNPSRLPNVAMPEQVVFGNLSIPAIFGHRKPYLILRIVGVQIRHFVENDNLLEASELLLEVTEFCDRNQYNEVSLLRSNICAIEKHQRTGTLDYGQIRIERNRLGFIILDFVDRI